MSGVRIKDDPYTGNLYVMIRSITMSQHYQQITYKNIVQIYIYFLRFLIKLSYIQMFPSTFGMSLKTCQGSYIITLIFHLKRQSFMVSISLSFNSWLILISVFIFTFNCVVVIDRTRQMVLHLLQVCQ